MLMISDLTTNIHIKRSNPLSFNQCGIENCSPGHFYDPRIRYHCIIHFVMAGKGIVLVDHKKYEVQAGEAFLIPPNAEGYYMADAKEPWNYFWLSFAGTGAEQCTERIFQLAEVFHLHPNYLSSSAPASVSKGSSNITHSLPDRNFS